MVKLMRKWYKTGIIDKDILVQKDGKGAYHSGKAAYSNVDFVEEAQLQGAIPGAKMEKADVHPEAKPVSDFKMYIRANPGIRRGSKYSFLVLIYIEAVMV